MSGSSALERGVAAVLTALALGSGAWALWPAFSPAPRSPTVTHVALPAPVSAELAPVYATTASIKPLISGKLNLNTASQEQLEGLPSIGPAWPPA